jgi:thioesterase domain-containing protein/acyl carrier protein
MEFLNASELRDELSSLGIEIYADNGRLRVNAPKGALTEKLQNAVSTKKPQLLELLEGEQPPLTRTESRLAGIWKNILGLEKVDKSDDFFELGGHSLLAMRMLAVIEAEFGRRIDLATLFEAPTIESLASAIDRVETKFDFRKVVTLYPQAAQPQIFGICSTGAYYLLAKKLGPKCPLTSLQLFDPSFPRDRLPESIEEIASQYVQLIRQLQPKGPYQLMGWCAAGILTIEIAHQLLSLNEKVSFVALVEAYAPVQYRRFGWLQSQLALNSFRLRWNLAELKKVFANEVSLTDFFADRQSMHKAASIVRRAFASGPNDVEADFERWLMAEYLVSAARKYQLKTFPGQLHLFRATKMPKGLFLDKFNGWGEYATQGVELAFIDGDHNSIFRQPGVDRLAEKIASFLADATETSKMANSGISNFEPAAGLKAPALDLAAKTRS